jgi:hypothetical protein
MTDASSTPSPAGGSKSTAWGAIVVIVGLVVVAGVFIGALVKFSDSKDIVAVIGWVTGVVGTIVTAFFGIHATASAGADATSKVSAAGAAAADRVAAATAEAADRVSSEIDKAAAAQQEAHNRTVALAAYLDPGKADEVLAKLGFDTVPTKQTLDTVPEEPPRPPS